MEKLVMPKPYGQGANYYRSHFYFRTGSFPYTHSHDGYWEFIFVTDGEYNHVINGERIVHKKNAAILLRPNDSHCIIERSSPSSYFVLCVNDNYFKEFLGVLDEKLYGDLYEAETLQAQATTAFTRLLKEITDEYYATKESHYTTCNRLLLAVTEIILTVPKEIKPTYSAGVEAFIGLLSDPENLKLPLRDLIAQTNYSYSHLNSIFKAEVGVTPSEFLRDKRLACAKRMLTTSSVKNESIAAAIGFATHARFCVFFKERTGLTPSQYAKKNSMKYSMTNNH